MLFTWFVTGPTAVEGAHPLRKAEEFLRCPDARQGQGYCRRVRSHFTCGSFDEDTRRSAIDNSC